MTYLNYGPEQVRDILASTEDLGQVERALVREQAIRKGMAKTSEGRETVADMLDAMRSMDEEAVLDLTEGEPTTLSDALARYVRILETWDEVIPRDRVGTDLDAILEYPWPAEEERLASHGVNQSLRLDVRRIKNAAGVLERVEIRIGDNGWKILAADSEHHSWKSLEAIASAAGHVHQAVLARVIADRDHHIQLSGPELSQLREFLDRPNGSATAGGRLTVDACGAGVIVRTRPYAYQFAVNVEQRRSQRETAEQVRRALDNS